MSQHPDDDPTTHLLGRLRQPPAAPPSSGAANARRTAARRQVGAVAAAGALVAAIAVGIPVGIAVQDDAAPAPLATQQPTQAAPDPSVSPERTDAPTPTDAPPLTAAPEPTGTPGSTAEAGPTSAPSATPDTITPVLEVTATDRGPARAGELASFVHGDVLPEADLGGETSWNLDPCEPTAYPQDADRTGWWSQRDFIGDSGGGLEVATYQTEAQAAEVVLAFGRVTSACWAPPSDQSAPFLWQAEASEDPSIGFSGVGREYAVPGSYEVEGEVVAFRYSVNVAAVRSGRHVALVTSYSGLGAGLVARAQGDQRPGAGAGLFDVSVEEAAAQVAGQRAFVEERASELLAAAEAHTGG